MVRIALVAACAGVVLALPAAAFAQGPPQPMSIKAKPDPVRVGDTVKLVGRDWLTRTVSGTCDRRVKLAIEEPGKRPVKIGAARVTSTGSFVFRWVVRDRIGNRAQSHGRSMGLKINGQQACYEGGRKIVIGESGEMTIIGASIAVAPDGPAIGDTLTVRGRDWAGRANCERFVRLSLRRAGTTVKLGRARVRADRRFRRKAVIEGVRPADDWKVVAVQRCEDGRDRFAIKRRLGGLRIRRAPTPPPEEDPPPQD